MRSLLLVGATVSGASATAAELNVDAQGVAEAKGHVTFRVYQGKDGWLEDDGAVATFDHSLEGWNEGDPVQASFDLPAGRYAVSVYHDEDGDGELDSNFIGIPREPAGLSNKPKARMGPPRYDDAAFDLPEAGHSITVELE